MHFLPPFFSPPLNLLFPPLPLACTTVVRLFRSFHPHPTCACTLMCFMFHLLPANCLPLFVIYLPFPPHTFPALPWLLAVNWPSSPPTVCLFHPPSIHRLICLPFCTFRPNSISPSFSTLHHLSLALPSTPLTLPFLLLSVPSSPAQARLSQSHVTPAA